MLVMLIEISNLRYAVRIIADQLCAASMIDTYAVRIIVDHDRCLEWLGVVVAVAG